MPAAPAPLTDPFGRSIRYLRLSVTDRCDYRCLYCMAETMTFLPRQQVLTLEELAEIGRTFVGLGVTKIRLTGGEPLIRNNIVHLVQALAATSGLQELCLTTNGSHLKALAGPLKAAGLHRINVSLDSLNPTTFNRLTRYGQLTPVLEGLKQAQAVGFERIKLNSVLLKGQNGHEAVDLVRFALHEGFDISFIEEMPLGQVTSHSRQEAFISSADLRQHLQPYFPLTPCDYSSGGPARYYTTPGFSSRIGFISPHSENFCGQCNRVRVTAEGRLLLCLGNEHSLDLRRILREHPQQLRPSIIQAMQLKPEKHRFSHAQAVEIVRFMNATGG